MDDPKKLQQEITALTASVKTLDAVWKKTFHSSSQQTESLKKRIQELGRELKNTDKLNMNHLSKKLSTLKKEINDAELSMKNFKGQTGDAFSALTASLTPKKALGHLREMASEVIKMEQAMSQLSQTAGLSSDQYDDTLNLALKHSKNLGRSVHDTLTSITGWYQTGMTDMKKAAEYADLSGIYANTGQLKNTEDSITNISAALNSFHVDDAAKVLDIYTKLGNKENLSSGSLGSGVKTMAPTFAATGNTLEETAAILAGAGTQTGNITELGEAAVVGALRLASMKKELTDIHASCNGIDTIRTNQSKLLKLTKGQVDIFDAQNQSLKSTYQIWKDLSSVWSSIESGNQNSILELMFGSDHKNPGAAIIQKPCITHFPGSQTKTNIMFGQWERPYTVSN